MQIDDILKAAIKDAGLESNLEILNGMPHNSPTNGLTINTNSNSQQYFVGNDDDFNLNDLDFSILNGAITPPQSTSPSTSSVSSSNGKSLYCNTTNVTPNGLLPDDSDPFLMAIKELDENNSKLEQQLHHQLQQQQNECNKPVINYNENKNYQQQQQQPILKIVSINKNTNSNGSDLLSLLNYRASNPNVKYIEKIPDTKIVQGNSCVKSFSASNLKQLNSPAISKQMSSSLVNPIKVINLSQIQQKSLQDKLTPNHKLIQITNRPPIAINAPSSSTNTSSQHHQSDNHYVQHNSAVNSNNSNSNIKITKVVSSRPLASSQNPNPNHNLIYINNNNNSTKLPASNMISINGFSNYSKPVPSISTSTTNITFKNANLKQQPPTMRLIGNSINGNSNNNSSVTSPPVQYITKIAAPNLTNSNGFLAANNNIPRFYAKPTRIIATNVPPVMSHNGLSASNLNSDKLDNNLNTSTYTNGNSHINILNSNISRYLNQSKQSNAVNNMTATSVNSNNISNTNNINSSVIINPKYLPTNLYNNNNNNNTQLSMMSNGQLNEDFNNNSNFNNSNYNSINMSSSNLNQSLSYQNYFMEFDEDVVVEEEEELGHAETYANYMPSKLKIGQPHPDPIVETSSLASVEPPDVWYNLKMSESVYSNGSLSALQLEAIVYACQKHQEFLPNNHRCGFLIGDGAGVGKGRTIAGMIYENYLVGRKKALWLSVSNDLKFDSQRDLADIGASKIQVHSLNKLKYCKISSKQNSKIKKGVIFSTYSSLIGESQHKTTKKKYNSRLKQLIQWLGGKSFDGLIIFDECHKAKNLVPVGSAKPTKTGLAVLELQEKLPNARIVYASATGASEPKNMAYMVRLGLWGPGTPFSDFNDFIQSIEKRGVGAMEIVAMDMKLRGMYIARQLSFSGVTFKIEEIPLNKEYVKMYNDAVKLWVEMKDKFQEAIDLIDTEGKLKKTVWGQFWSSHQRFFKYLCMACKVPYVVELSKSALLNKKCVVIGLQSTGEARTLEQIDELGEINEFISTARGVLQNLVEKHFPSFENTHPNNASKTVSNSISTRNNKTAPAVVNKPSSFFDILGVGDQIRQQLYQKSKLAKSKESRNSQKINDILKRLSTYTNSTTISKANEDSVENAKLKQQSKKRSSSMSSSSSISSSIPSSSELNNNNNINSQESDLDSDEYENSDLDDSYNEDDDEEEEIDEIDMDDENLHDAQDNNNFFKMDTVCRHDNDNSIEKYANSKISTEITLDLSPVSREEHLFESDDSDSLFSITKSVSVQSLMIKNQIRRPKLVNGTSNHLNNKLRKRKKNKATKINVNGGYENEEEDDEDEIGCENEMDQNNGSEDTRSFLPPVIKEEHSSSDDDFKLPSKRIKNKSECVNMPEEALEIQIKEEDQLLTTCKPADQQQSRPKPTQPYEIADYVCEMKRDLLNAIQQLGKRLPANTLDELIDLLDGPDKVAEMTGRKGRVVCRTNNEGGENNYVYETRNETDVPVELMNVVQKERFMNGEKLIAIISEAASSGISLQANRRYANQCRRVHITIELPWSADRAIQQFGRTHRSNQVSAPEYVFIISELAGEKRFASTVAKRLESLGALTHGDRRATESRDLSRFNIDNKYGRSALENVIKSICNIEKPMAKLPKNYSGNFMKEAREALHGVGVIICDKNGLTAYPDKDYNSINKFLNRLLGCPVELQNAIFTFFSDVLAAVILEAKRTGKWDMGILDLGSNNEIVFRIETKFFTLNNSTDTVKRVEMHTVLVERGLSWEKALEIYKKINYIKDESTENETNETAEGFYISNQVKNNHKIAILAIISQPNGIANDQSKKSNFLSIYRPNTGLQVRQETTESILKKYKKITPAEAKQHWDEQFIKSATECTHVYRQAHCSNSRNCEVGLRTRKFYILAGSVLTVWTKVETTLSNLTCSNQFRLQIIRVKTDDNQKIVGCVIPSMCLKQIDVLLCSMSSKFHVQIHQNENKAVGKGENENILNDSNKTASKQITPVISLKTKSIFKVNSLTSIKNTNSNEFAIVNKKFNNNIEMNNYSNTLINYDYT